MTKFYGCNAFKFNDFVRFKDMKECDNYDAVDKNMDIIKDM
jgi:hypothetical protein